MNENEKTLARHIVNCHLLGIVKDFGLGRLVKKYSHEWNKSLASIDEIAVFQEERYSKDGREMWRRALAFRHKLFTYVENGQDPAHDDDILAEALELEKDYYVFRVKGEAP